VLSNTQSAILLRISEFGVEVKSSWDVPRALSLPGLAEHLGLVRSAIHNPLKELEEMGLIETRLAHVIDGGSRKRTVVHLTSLGHERVESISSDGVSKSRGISVGPLPQSVNLIGREEIVHRIVEKMLNFDKIQLSGLPGIGKTSIARKVADEVMDKGWKVCWSTCNFDTDISIIGSTWLNGESPRDPQAIASAVSSKKTLLILDEVQELSSRHTESISELLQACSTEKVACLISVRAPSPFGKIEGFEELRIDGLKTIDALNLLPQNIDSESAEKVVEALGGHPLALRLWDYDDEMPAKGQAVTEYVQKTVLTRLNSEATSTLDELSLSPLPLAFDEVISEDGAWSLEESAVLRWVENLIEPHHLIRNVRLSIIDEESVRAIHSKSAILWAQREGSRARRIEAHHRLSSGDDIDPDWLVNIVEMISQEDSAAAAVLIEDASLSIDNEKIHFAAVDLALERGEHLIAESHLDMIEESPQSLIRRARIYRYRGDNNSAQKAESEAVNSLSPAERVRLQISSLVRCYDDRLPGESSDVNIEQLSEIDLSLIPDTDKSAAALSINLLRHALALDSGDVEAAANTRSYLAVSLGEDHPLLSLIDLRTRLSFDTPDSLEIARKYIEEEEDLMSRTRAILFALESSHPEIPQWLKNQHAMIKTGSLRKDLPSHRRLVAQCWYWRGVLEPNMRLSHWREAINRFKSAECSKASSELLVKLSRSL